jgi:hypothetical protein
MWLYVPCASSPSVPASECTTLDSEQCLLLASSVTSSGKHSPPRSWSAWWKRAPWLRRLSGLIWPPSTLARFADEWIASLPVSPASPTASPESNSAMMTTGRSATEMDPSCTSFASSTSVTPPWSSSRTSQLGFLEDGFDPSERNYADWVTRSKTRSFSLRRTLAQRTSANASGSWPTSRAEDSESCGNHPGSGGDALNAVASLWNSPRTQEDGSSEEALANRKARAREKYERGEYGANSGPPSLNSLTAQVSSWPSPDSSVFEASPESFEHRKAAMLAKKYNGNGAGMVLGTAVQNWPSPRGMDASGAGYMNQRDGSTRPMLSGAVESWPTPLTRDERSPDLQGSGNYQRKIEAGFTIDLNSLAANWASPTARMTKGGGRAVTRRDGKSRLDMLDWQAEAYSLQDHETNDGRSSSKKPDISRRQLLLALIAADARANSLALSDALRLASIGERDVALPRASLPLLRELFRPKARLNPAFGCWLMGLSWWWTNPGVTSCVQSAMAEYRSALRSHGARLLGESLSGEVGE